MSNNAESTVPVKVIENSSNELINWIGEANFKCYEYSHFNAFHEIGFGGFGKVYRANWKNFHNHLALKSFFNFNDITVKEIVNEVQCTSLFSSVCKLYF